MIALNHIRQLASQHHTIDLICFKSRKNPTDLGDLPHCCNRIDLIDRPPRPRVLLNMLAGLIRDPHREVSRVRSAEMTRAVDRKLNEEKYDVVLFQLLQMAQFKPSGYQGRSMWCLEDPPVLKSWRSLPLCRWREKPLAWISAKRLKNYEAAHAVTFDRVILVNREDARDYKTLLNQDNVDWVPSGIDVDSFRPSAAISRREGMIVITGNMFHPPNVDGVEYFCREIFPLVCQRVPAATLWLVGAGPVSSIRKLTSDPRITVTGFVPDIRPYLQEAMVSACPIRLKIGTQTKVLEALACGTPVVTTPEGNHGIEATSGEHLYVARNPADFADQVVRLLATKVWSSISEKGRQFVEANFAWEKSAGKLEKILDELAADTTLDYAAR